MNNICQHFEICGGCNLQDLNQAAYKQYNIAKSQKFLPTDFKNDINPGNYFQVAEYSRRRAVFQVKRNQLGFSANNSNKFVAITECLILDPQIFALKNKLQYIIAQVKIKCTKIAVSLVGAYLDVIFYLEKELELKQIEALREFANSYNIARININLNKNYESLIILNSPIAKINEHRIKLPINYFLQATLASEQKMQQIIQEWLPAPKIIIELFAGIGTFGLSLENYKKLLLVEGNNEAMQAAHNAINLAQNTKAKTLTQDLFNRPFKAAELNKFETIIINPPRNGASPQFKEIAKSNIQEIIIISCNPHSLARDLEYLANYKIAESFIIDQFLYSKHVELMLKLVRQ